MACQRPENDLNNVVCRIRKAEIGASSESKINGEKARCYGNRARNDICRVEEFQDEIKSGSNRCGGKKHNRRFKSGY